MKVDFYSTTSMPKSIKREYLKIFRQTLDKDNLIDGLSCRQFEEAFSRYLSVPHVLGVGNGFDALKIGLQALGIVAGDLIAVPAHTFIATWYAVMAIGAVPVGIDVTIDGQIDLDKLEKVENLKGVIPVHMHGTHCDMERLVDWAKKNKVIVLEDCAQAAGLEIQGKQAGTWGDAGAFSFYPTKNLFALGDGGAICAKNASVIEKARCISRYGTKHDDKYVHNVLGQNSRLDSIQAGILSFNLKLLNGWNENRKHIAAIYNSELGQFRPEKALWGSNIFHHYVIYVKNRDRLKANLKEIGIGTEIHYPHLAALEVNPDSEIRFPISLKISQEGLSLPMSPWQTESETEYVMNEVLRILNA